jgi:3-mercaptopyruvate sulfurtransferase SseA
MLLDGGLEGWTAGGGGTITERARLEPRRWLPEPEPVRLASLDHVRASYGRDGVEIIDARGHYAWLGPTERGEWDDPPRVGHIPHALPFDFTILLRPDGSLREPAENRDEFARLGPRPANPVDLRSEFIVYGEGPASDGVLAYFLLRRAGIDTVRWYPGGWKEWSGDPSLPIVRILPADELAWRLDRERRLLKSDSPAEMFAFFDVRHPADYARGHIRGSVSLRSDYFADSLDVRLERYWPQLNPATAPVVTYCYGEHCIRSRATSTAAARAGFVRVERFYGGLDEWRSSGGGLARSEWPPGGE